MEKVFLDAEVIFVLVGVEDEEGGEGGEYEW